MANRSEGGHVHLRKGVKASDGQKYNLAGSAGEEAYALTDDEAKAIRGVTDMARAARILREMRSKKRGR